MGEKKGDLYAEKRSRMEYLAQILREASKAYYAKDTEIMSNLEYDALYDELAAIGVLPANSNEEIAA